MKTLFRFCLDLCLLIGLLAFAGCAGTNKSGPLPQAKSTQAIPTSQVYSVMDNQLADLVIQFLATSKTKDPRTYEERRQALALGIADYLAINGHAQAHTLKFNRDGMTFLLPVQFISPETIDSSSESDLFLADKKTILSNLRGEILDLAWLPDRRRDSGRLLALFADSLAIVAPSDGKALLKVLRFQGSTRPIRPIHPSGFLAHRPAIPADRSSFVIQTTSLEAPLIFELKSERLRAVRSADLIPSAQDLTSWLFQKGGNLVQSRSGKIGVFRSLRTLSDTRHVSLDPAGYLRLLDTEFQSIRTSARPWGDRLFVLGSDILVVCDSRQNSFVAFEVKNDSLALLGQSPRFEGRICAMTVGSFGGREGIFIGTSRTTAGRELASSLHFVDGNSFSWRLPVTLLEPMFPDLDRQLWLNLSADSPDHLPDNPTGIPAALEANVFETLYRIGDGEHASPLLARAARPDQSGRLWEVRLKQGIHFSNGSPLTASAVQEGWERSWRQCYRTKCPSNWLWENVQGAYRFVSGESQSISGLEVIDELTLRVTLNKPRQHFAEHLAQPCFAVTKVDVRSPTLIGTGPYQLERPTVDGDSPSISLNRHERYHAGYPPLKRIQVSFANTSAVDALINQKSVGALLKSKPDIELLSQVDHLKLRAFPEPCIYFVALNPFKAPFSDPNQRRRLLASIAERELLAEIITEAKCTVATTFLGSQRKPAIQPAETSRLSVNRPLSIAYRARDPVASQIAERLAARLTQVAAFDHVKLPMSAKEFEEFRRGSTYDILIDFFTSSFLTPVYNLAQLINQGYPLDGDILEQLPAALADSSLETADRIERLLIDRALLYPLVSTQTSAALPKMLQNVGLSGDNQLDLSKAWLPTN